MVAVVADFSAESGSTTPDRPNNVRRLLDPVDRAILTSSPSMPACRTTRSPSGSASRRRPAWPGSRPAAVGGDPRLPRRHRAGGTGPRPGGDDRRPARRARPRRMGPFVTRISALPEVLDVYFVAGRERLPAARRRGQHERPAGLRCRAPHRDPTVASTETNLIFGSSGAAVADGVPVRGARVHDIVSGGAVRWRSLVFRRGPRHSAVAPRTTASPGGFPRLGGSSVVDRPQTIAYPAPDARPRPRDGEPLAPHVIVLFGATGDLAKRKLLPGMAYLAQSSLAPGHPGRRHGDGRHRHRRSSGRWPREAVESFGTPQDSTTWPWADFADRLTYVPQGAGPGGAADGGGQGGRDTARAGLSAAALPVGAAQGGRGRHRDAARRGPGRERPGW